jgi:1D-myo-inositol 3-kinase
MRDKTSTRPQLVVIGHATRDLLPDGGWRLGGGVAYAGVTAQRLGLRVGVITSAPADVLSALQDALPDAAILNLPARVATTFENIYDTTGRRQFLRAQAEPLTLDLAPSAWADAEIALLAPLAQEVDPGFARIFPRALVAATPQGWLRRWDATGAVTPGPLEVAPHLLPHVRALILSRDDLLSPGAADLAREREADAIIAAWARQVALVAVTRGPDGALLYLDGRPAESFAGAAAHEADPTGAGDIFAAALLYWLARTGDARAAASFANHVAAYSVESAGIDSTPTLDQLMARFPAAGFARDLAKDDQSASSN